MTVTLVTPPHHRPVCMRIVCACDASLYGCMRPRLCPPKDICKKGGPARRSTITPALAPAPPAGPLRGAPPATHVVTDASRRRRCRAGGRRTTPRRRARSVRAHATRGRGDHPCRRAARFRRHWRSRRRRKAGSRRAAPRHHPTIASARRPPTGRLMTRGASRAWRTTRRLPSWDRRVRWPPRSGGDQQRTTAHSQQPCQASRRRRRRPLSAGGASGGCGARGAPRALSWRPVSDRKRKRRWWWQGDGGDVGGGDSGGDDHGCCCCCRGGGEGRKTPAAVVLVAAAAVLVAAAVAAVHAVSVALVAVVAAGQAMCGAASQPLRGVRPTTTMTTEGRAVTAATAAMSPWPTRWWRRMR